MKWSPAWCGFIVEKGDTREQATIGCNAGDVIFFGESGAMGLQVGSRPIAIRRKGCEQIEALNVGHAARWQQMQNDAKTPVTAIDPPVRPDQLTAVQYMHGKMQPRPRKAEAVSGLQILQDEMNRIAREVSSAVWGAIPPGTLVSIDPALKPDQYVVALLDEILCVGGIDEPLPEPEPEPEPFPVSSDPSVYDAAMGALVGKVRERQLVGIVLPIDDREHMAVAVGCRDSDGYNHKPYVKRVRENRKQIRRAPFGIDTLAPQSGFCSSGVIYGAMPDE